MSMEERYIELLEQVQCHQRTINAQETALQELGREVTTLKAVVQRGGLE